MSVYFVSMNYTDVGLLEVKQKGFDYAAAFLINCHDGKIQTTFSSNSGPHNTIVNIIILIIIIYWDNDN